MVEQNDKLIQERYQLLTERQYNILDNYFQLLVRNLSNRSRNALRAFMSYSLSMRVLEPIIFNKDFDLYIIPSIGYKSEIEIRIFFRKIKAEINKVHKLKTESDFLIAEYSTYLRLKFNLTKEDTEGLWVGYTNVEDGFPIFKTVDLLFKKKCFLTPNETFVIERKSGLRHGAEIRSFEEIGAIINRRCESVRLMRQSAVAKIFDNITFIKEFDRNQFNLYDVDQSQEIIHLPDSLIKKINEEEQNNINNAFIMYIYSVLFSETHTLVGRNVFNKPHKNTSIFTKWAFAYLIKNEYCDGFDFEGYMNSIRNRLFKRIKDDYLVSFNDSSKKFFKNKKVKTTEILPYVTMMLKDEFDININDNQELIIKRNTKRYVYEYIYDILEENRKPMNINDIYKRLKEKEPKLAKSVVSVRANCQNGPEIICFGRTSTYGLKQWEKEFEHIKGGTMHDITEEFLTRYDEPRRIHEVMEYIRKYRPEVKLNSLRANLKSAEGKRFVFFDDSYVGIVSKTYDDVLPIRKEFDYDVRTWEDSYKLLKDFMKKNNRMPSSVKGEDELRLYRFFNLQKNKLNNNKLNDTKKKKIIKLKEEAKILKAKSRKTPR